MDPMALVSSITQYKAAETAMKVQYAVAAKMLKMSRSQGQAVVSLIEAAGKSFDQALAAVQGAVDPSRDLDVYA